MEYVSELIQKLLRKHGIDTSFGKYVTENLRCRLGWYSKSPQRMLDYLDQLDSDASLPATCFAPEVLNFPALYMADNPRCELCGNYSLQVVCQCGHVCCANCQAEYQKCMVCGTYIKMMLVDKISESLDKQLTFRLSECIITTTLRTFYDSLVEFLVSHIRDLEKQHAAVPDCDAIAKYYHVPLRLASESLNVISQGHDSFPLLDSTVHQTDETDAHDLAATNVYISTSDSAEYQENKNMDSKVYASLQSSDEDSYDYCYEVKYDEPYETDRMIIENSTEQDSGDNLESKSDYENTKDEICNNSKEETMAYNAYPLYQTTAQNSLDIDSYDGQISELKSLLVYEKTLLEEIIKTGASQGGCDDNLKYIFVQRQPKIDCLIEKLSQMEYHVVNYQNIPPVYEDKQTQTQSIQLDELVEYLSWLQAAKGENLGERDANKTYIINVVNDILHEVAPNTYVQIQYSDIFPAVGTSEKSCYTTSSRCAVKFCQNEGAVNYYNEQLPGRSLYLSNLNVEYNSAADLYAQKPQISQISNNYNVSSRTAQSSSVAMSTTQLLPTKRNKRTIAENTLKIEQKLQLIKERKEMYRSYK